MKVLGFDIGGSYIKAGVVEGTDLLSWTESKTPQGSKEHIYSKIEDIYREFVSKHREEIKAIGIGCGGRFCEGGVFFTTSALPKDWIGAKVSQELSDKLGLPVLVHNDVDMAAYGEYCLRVKEKFSDLVFVAVGTGIGGGLIIDGELVTGGTNSAAELGHLHVGKDRVCSCGRRGCVELYASGHGMLSSFEVVTGRQINANEFWRLYQEGNAKVTKIVHRGVDYLVGALLDVQELLAPQAFIMGGGVIQKQPTYFKQIRKQYRQRVSALSSLKRAEVVKTSLGREAVVLGSAVRAKDYFVNE